MPNAAAVAAAELAQACRRFVDRHIVPAEPALAGSDADGLLAGLAGAARQAGLWGAFHPGGRLDRLQDYLAVAEQEGRSEFGPTVFGSDTALDARLLERYGSAAVRARFLPPLLRGEAVASYAMSEPDGVGSMPSTIATTARRVDGGWRIDGRKWFICRADRASFVTVVARSGEDGGRARLSMLLVPADAPGFRIVREQAVLGRVQGQCELAFDGVRVPDDHLLGELHQGLTLMHWRLGLGRVLRSAQWLGLARRSVELMLARIAAPRGRLADLAGKQLIRRHVFESELAIRSARALLAEAAGLLDDGGDGEVAVNLAKVAASRALCQAADSAVQVWGAEGLCDRSPLSGIYRAARATRILDGTDEALINAVGKQLIRSGAGVPA
ncbi:acyl-CoA dehydrogenase family protein [Chitinimonas koreensis]|nr:acyl-CoA dehydrogenase family protein [Chitinimonas koreensis]